VPSSRRATTPTLALAASALLACGGGGGSSAPEPQPGDPCTTQAACGHLLCFEGSCVTALPDAPSCPAAGGAPTLVAGAAVVASDPGAGVCSHSIVDPVFPAGVVQALGEHGVGEQVGFTVPPGTWSISIYEQEVDDSAPDAISYLGQALPNAAVPTDVRMPGGEVFYDDTPASVPLDPDGYLDFTGFFSVHFGSPTPWVGVATFPNAPPGLDLARVAGELPAGDWTLRVNDWALECTTFGSACTGGSSAGRYRVHVVTEGPPASTGALDLDVYLATSGPSGEPRLTAAEAATDPGLARLFQGVATVLGRAGLCLGTVTFHDLPDWARLRFESTLYDPSTLCDEMHQMFQLSTASGRGPSLFMVDELLATYSRPGQTLLGVDGSIPGPSGLPGTPASGAVMSFGSVPSCTGAFSPASCRADELAVIASHELGHWLGLFHTSESTGTDFDPLTDTPRCSCAHCTLLADRGRCGDPTDPMQMTPGLCNGVGSCSGASNLMFWAYDPSISRGAITPQQAEVVRLDPAVRAEPAP